MATVAVRKRAAAKKQLGELGPRAAGLSMTLREFDEAEFAEGYRYELINGVLVVSPIPLPQERSPNEVLAQRLLNYRDSHPQGSALNATLPEHIVETPKNRRRADRVVWAGLARRPPVTATPTLIFEFVSAGKRNYKRDYEEKRDEYLAMGVKEYVVVDRFQRTFTVFTLVLGQVNARVLREKQTYTTPLLPDFKLPLAEVFAAADEYADSGEDEN